MEGIPADNKPKVQVSVVVRRQIARNIQPGLEIRQTTRASRRSADIPWRQLTWRVHFQPATAGIAPFHTFEVETTPATDLLPREPPVSHLATFSAIRSARSQ
jgi:hypothetical protein